VKNLWIRAAFGMIILLSLLSGCSDDNDENADWSGSDSVTSLDTSQLPNIDEDTVVYPNTSITDSLLYTLQTSNGGTIQYFGEKDEDGTHLSVREVCIETASGQHMTILSDSSSRPTHLSRGDGRVVEFDWDSKTITETDGSIQCGGFSDTVAKQSRPERARRVLHESIFSVLQSSAYAKTNSPAQEKCMSDYEQSKKVFSDACSSTAVVIAQKLGGVGVVLQLLCINSEKILDFTFGAAWEYECENKYKTCNADAGFSGGVGIQGYHFEMGKPEGTFTLSYEFYTVPDQIHVLYDGKVIYKTSCTGGSQSVNIPYSGSSTDIAVEVWGDCSSEGDTAWDFNVSCPE